LAADSDLLVASQKATKAYADTKQTALGFTPEDVANKATSFTTVNDTLYPTVKAVNDQLTLIPFDPSKVTYYDDFFNRIVNLTASTNVLGLSSFLQAGGRINSLAPGQGFSDANGVLRLETQASTTGGGAVGALYMGINPTLGSITMKGRFRLETLSTPTERYTILIGIGSVNSYLGVGQILLRYSDDINSGKFQMYKSLGGVATADTGVTADINTWYNIEIQTVGTTATFFINGVNVGTLDITGVNNDFGIYFDWRKSVGSTNRNVYLDYLFGEQILTTPR
jgi:hypothetical protein